MLRFLLLTMVFLPCLSIDGWAEPVKLPAVLTCGGRTDDPGARPEMTKDLILLRDGTKLTGIRPTPHGSEAYLGIIGPGMVVVLANGEARSGRWLATFNGKPGSLELSGERVLAMGARRSCKLTFAQALE